MSISRELLMRYHDGAVSEAEARVVEEALEQEPELLEELEAYSELGSFVRAWGDARSDKLVDLAASVMSAIESEERPQPVAARQTVHSLLPRLATWVSLSAAIAAGSVLVARSWSAPRVVPGAAPAAGAANQPTLAPASAAPPDVSAALEEEPKPPPATIESVNFGDQNGTVFVVSTDDSETPVVWMPDDDEPDEDTEGRSESL